MKKVVGSSLISVIILILIAGGFIYLQKFRSGKSNVLDAVPSDVAWLLSCDPSSGDLRQLANTGFFSGADTIEVLSNWKRSLLAFDSIAVNTTEIKQLFKAHPLIMTGHVTSPRHFSIVYLANLGETNAATVTRLVQKLSGRQDTPSSRNYNGMDIREFQNEKGGVDFAYTISKGIFIGSSASYLVEDAIRQQRSDKSNSPVLSLEPLLRDAGGKSVVALRYEGFEKWLQTHLVNGAASLSELQKLGEWTCMRMDIQTNHLTFSGNTTVSDSSQFLQLFSDQKPVTRNLTKHLLSSTAAFISWGLSNPQMFFSDYGNMLEQGNRYEWEGYAVDSLRKKLAFCIQDEVGIAVIKPVTGQKDYQYFALINLSQPDTCIAILKRVASGVSGKVPAEEKYNGSVIRMIPGIGLMPQLFGPLFGKIGKFYYTIIDNTLLVTNQVTALRSYINDYRLENFLKNDSRYTALEKPLPALSNLYFYCSIPQSEKLFTSVGAPQWTSWLAKYSSALRSWNGLTMTISSQGGIFKTVAGLGYFQDTLSAPRTLWKKDVDSTIIAGPFAPHSSGEILVQDRTYGLSAIGTSGEIIWRKQLESRILGPVHSALRGGDTVMFFNTFSFLYMLRKDGSACEGFPIRLPAAASSGSGFDSIYGRIYIPCLNMKLMGYTLTGKAAPLYFPFRLRQVVRTVPVILENRTILLHGENNGGWLVKTNGSILHTIRQDVMFAPGTSFMSDTTSPAGYAWLTPDGKYILGGNDGIPESMTSLSDGDTLTGAIKTDLNGDGEADWLFTLKTGLRGSTSDGVSLFVYTSENPMYPPVVTKRGNKVLFAVTDSSRIYVFNQNGSMYEGFPVAGNGQPLFVKGQDGNIDLVFTYSNKTVQRIEFR